MRRDWLFEESATTYDYLLAILHRLGPVDPLWDNTDLAVLSPRTVQGREYRIRIEELEK